MDIQEIASFVIGIFIVVWLVIFLIPFTTFTEEMTETIEECRNRIINELPSLVNDTDNLDKTLNEYCNPQKGGFANIPKFANWLNNNIVAWIFVSFFMTIAFFIILILITVIIILIFLAIKVSENQGVSYGV